MTPIVVNKETVQGLVVAYIVAMLINLTYGVCADESITASIGLGMFIILNIILIIDYIE